MEFRSLTNIETSFKQIRLYAAAFVVLCIVITGIVVYSSYAFANRQREKIYVLDNGKSLILALSQDAAANRPVEAREHVRRFHELFFTVAPDKDAIEKNMERAFLLCDKTAYDYYRDLAEKGYFNRIISGNINQRVEVDSIRCDFDRYPYEVTTYARQFIVRPSNFQGMSRAIPNGRMVVPYGLEVTFDKTTHLIFPVSFDFCRPTEIKSTCP